MAAGAVAEKYLAEAFGIEIVAFVSSVGKVHIPRFPGEALSSSLAKKAGTSTLNGSAEGGAGHYGAPDVVPGSEAAQKIGAVPSSALDNVVDNEGMTEDEAEEPLSKEFRQLMATVTRKKVDENDIRCPHPEAAERMREVRASLFTLPFLGADSTLLHSASYSPNRARTRSAALSHA